MGMAAGREQFLQGGEQNSSFYSFIGSTLAMGQRPNSFLPMSLAECGNQY